MSELLYKRSKAVAAMNRVEGFEPLEFARTIQKEGQEDQLYLDVKYRKLWFRLCNPGGKIVKKILAIKDEMAIVEAKVYLDRNDPEESFIASALAQKFRSPDPQFGDKFLELAETAAVGRALGDAGYGIQFADADVSETNDPHQVDAGIPVTEGGAKGLPQANPSGGQYRTGQQMPPAFGQQPFADAQRQAGYAPIQQGMSGYMQPQAASKQPAPSNTQWTGVLDWKQPVEMLLSQLTYEQAKNVVIGGHGIHANKTMGQLAMEDPSALEWYRNTYNGPNNLLRAAAQFLLAKAAA